MQEPEGKKLTMDDAAKALGVSKTTVSRALSGKGRIGEETRQRVLEFFAQHKPHPNVPASEPEEPQPHTCNISMVMPAGLLSAELFSSELLFFPKALKGVSEVAAKEEYDVILTLADTNDLSELSRVIENRKADGLLWMRTLLDDRPAELLKKSGIPFVTVGMSRDPQVFQVDHDHTEACRELTSILLMKGLRKIAVVAGDMNYMVNRNRLEGFYKAYEELGFELDQSLVFTGVDSQSLADRATDAILMRSADCIIGADDLLASLVFKKLEYEKVLIPQDIRLAAFHDGELLKTAKPGITAIKFNAQELGRTACKVLMRRIHGEEVPQVTKLSYEVAIRESTK
ncbi:MAG: LacI family transcriptional regulator [Eubacterium sp.]|nr:LacI family transcriptional regulator [Eubacterium sp.]